MCEIPVDAMGFFIDIFKEQYLILCFNLIFSPKPGNNHGKAAACQLTFCISRAERDDFFIPRVFQFDNVVCCDNIEKLLVV